MKTLLLLGLYLLAGPASAQAIYQCRADRGVAYQATPCQGVSLRQWAHADEIAVPGPSLTRAQAERRIEATRTAWLASMPPPRPSRSAPRQRTSPSTRMPRHKPSACERARAGRAAAHARRGLRWSFDDASTWDARVFKVCR